ncbi:iron ABC transporter permease [Halovulum dunhuangense]|uniref:Iron ABC transporter permease n=1 Tax=Halovulum dunhuangense TaxID=1505036 RepID=A0A849L6Q6_9RHOB|nr:ABC transporter permease subunit [Halovulum dunhuangense]NNU81824.1 iron ABC transporter permease [Halovulum dunhuangense]
MRARAGATLAGMRFPGGGEGILVALAAFHVLALGLWPLGRLFLEAFGPGTDGATFGLIREALDSRAVSRAFWNTLAASAGSVVVSVVLGTGLALATGLLALRGRVPMTFLILSPLLIPSQILALAWIELMGSTSPVLRPLGLAPAPGQGNPLYSGAGVMWLLGIEHMPLVFLSVRAALLAVPQALVEAARIAGARRARILRRIVLPLAMPGVLAGAALAFASAVGNFGVPALLGIPGRFTMLTTLIYQRLNGFGPSVLGQVAVLALMLVALGGAALLLRAILAARAVPVERAGPAMAPIPPGRARLPVEAALWLLLLTLAILPLAALMATALIPALGVKLSLATVTLENFHEALASPAIRRAFANSFLLSLGAAGLSAVIALGLGYAAVIRGNRTARLLDQLADAPYVVPGTVLGIAYILVFLPPLPGIGLSIYGTATILFLAYLARFLPLVLRPVAATLAGLEPALDEAARIVGARPLRRLVFVMAPIAAPSAMAGAMLVFMTAFNELTVSALLWSSGVETVGVSVFSLQYEGNSTTAAALSVLSIAVVLGLALMLDRLSDRLPPGTLPWRQ